MTVSPMQRVSSFVSADIGNYLNNKQTWGSILYNVKSFGAKGDGVTDDTAAINKTLEASLQVGLPAFLPAGTYLIDTDQVNIDLLVGPGLIKAKNGNLISLISPGLEKKYNQKFLFEPFFGFNNGTTNTEIYTGAGRAAQGVAYLRMDDEDYVFIIQRCAGDEWATNERQRIVLFKLAEDGSITQNLGYSEELNVGHQGLSAIIEDGEVYLYSSMTVETGHTGDDAGKGYSKIKWRGSATSQSDVTNYQLFGYADSGQAYESYNNASPSVSTDGRYIIISCLDNKPVISDNARYGFVYDRAQVESADDPMDVTPLNIFPIVIPAEEDAYYTQGLACDGTYIYNLRGSRAVFGHTLIQVYSMQGEMVNQFQIDHVRAKYGMDNLLDHPTLGVPAEMEPEGLALRGKEFILLVTDVWRADAPIVAFKDLNWASVQPDNTNLPLEGQFWTRTLKDTTDGDWDAETTYDAGTYTRRNKMIYKVAFPSTDTDEQPVDNGIVDKMAGVRLNTGNNSTDLAYRANKVFQVSAYSERMGAYFHSFDYADHAIRIYDTRPDADNTKYSRFLVSFNEGRELAGVFAVDLLTTGAGTQWYGNNDPDSPGMIRDFTGGEISRRDTTADGETTFFSDATYVPLSADRPDTGAVFQLFRDGNLGIDVYMSSVRVAFQARNNRDLVVDTEKDGVLSNRIVISYNDGSLTPAADNAQTLGSASKRWSVVYAGTGSINTSDRNEKQQIASIPDEVLDAWAEVNFCQFKYNDAVQLKGADARLHVGVIAQDIKEAFEAKGLDATAYGLLCYDEWAAKEATEDTPAVEAGSRWGIRADECLFLEMALMRRELNALKNGG